jgi:hypothetical protein
MAAQSSGTDNRVIAWSPGNNFVSSAAVDTGLRRLKRTSRAGLSDQGVAFLKCAFAPPDFSGSSVMGVPDDYRGPSLTKKHRYVNSFTFSSGVDTYILLLPIPGYAYFYATVTANTNILLSTTFTGVKYSDYSSMFGSSGSESGNIVTKFRFASNHIELIPTVNQMIWSGQIQAWKLPISVIVRQGGATTSDLLSIEGLNGCNTGNSNQFSGPYIMGVYSGCYSGDSSFKFSDILENVNNIPQNQGAADFAQLVSPGTNSGIPGFDNGFQSLCLKVSGVTANETALLKTWACVEYQAVPNSSIYEFSSLSPCDPLSIELYKEIINNLPIGVPFEDNASFWNRVLGIINSISSVGAAVPGTIGMVSRGANLISGALLPFTNGR